MKMVYYVVVANIKHYDGREPISDSREYFYYGMATDLGSDKLLLLKVANLQEVTAKVTASL